jgi:hypothetical protein
MDGTVNPGAGADICVEVVKKLAEGQNNSRKYAEVIGN